MSARSRRVLALAATSTLVLGLTAACGSSGSDSAGGKVTLRYGIWDAVQKPALQKSIDAFEKAHPNITVKIELNAWAISAPCGIKQRYLERSGV